MIFNKQGSAIKRYKFFYKNAAIENVKEYKYLGFIFTCSGSDNAGITNLLKQAKKAWYAIRYYLRTSKNKQISTYLQIFDTQVRPILLYACEAWAESLKENETILQNLQKNSIEKFHMSVLKQLLGVHKKTSNIAVLLDTGRHPLSLTAKLQAIKYFLRFPAIKHNRLLSAYHESEKLTTGTFTNFVATNLNKIGMGNIWREQLIHNKNMSEDKKVMNGIRRRMTDISSQTIVTTLTKNTGKLDFLAISKKDHKFEKYLYIHNFEHRRAISKLRTSSHKLEIETGRWRKIQRENRIRQNCALNKVEDESHLLFDCQMHVAERK